MRVLFVGTRFLPYRHPGDKNFWLELLEGLAVRGLSMDVISLDLRPPPAQPSGPFGLGFVPAVPIRVEDRLSMDRYNVASKEIGSITNYYSRTLTLPRLIQTIRRRTDQTHYDCLHLMDNLGPMTSAIPACARAMPCVASAVTYNRRGRFYDSLLRMSFLGSSRVVAFSQAFANRLLEIGLEAHRVHRIRWGVDLNRFAPPANRIQSRAKLGIAPDVVLVAWAGFVQQTSTEDFRVAFRIAERLRERLDRRVRFFFCFKPSHFREEFARMRRPGIELTGDPEAFRLVRAGADALLAPIMERNTILAPPLTWIEFLASGVPIFTTSRPGAEEAVVPGQGGQVEPDPSRLESRLQSAIEDSQVLGVLQLGARAVACERFDLSRAVNEYVDLWKGLLDGS